MPLNYAALNQRVTDALASANPVNGLATIAQEMQYPRGDDYDHNIAELALSLLRHTPPDTAGAAYWMRYHFAHPIPAWAAPPPPVVVASPAAGEPRSGAPGVGGRRRRHTRRHRKTRKHSRKNK